MAKQSRSLVIATGNLHKVAEFTQLLHGTDCKLVSAQSFGGMPVVEETGSTFAENAGLKARALRMHVPQDMWIVADDSGLEVDALEGAPGVYSARYAGLDATDQDNVAKLLTALQSVPKSERTARFKCAVCVIDPAGSVTYHEGSCEGHIATEVSGKSGFGYDPVFIPDGYKESFAALGSSVKDRLSHRARAVRSLKDKLQPGI